MMNIRRHRLANIFNAAVIIALIAFIGNIAAVARLAPGGPAADSLINACRMRDF